MSHWHIGFAVCEAVYLTLVVVVVVVVVSHYAFSNFLSSRRLLFLAFHSLDGRQQTLGASSSFELTRSKGGMGVQQAKSPAWSSLWMCGIACDTCCAE